MLIPFRAAVSGRVGRARRSHWLMFVPIGIALLLACDMPPRDEAELATLYGERLPADATLREVLQHPDVFERVQRVAQILQRSEPSQLESIRDEFETAALERGDLEYVLFAHWWARFDPQAAFTYAYLHLRTDHPRVILEIVRVWGREDPLGAVASGSLAGLDFRMPDLLGEFVDQLVVGWFESGKPGLEDWIMGLDTAEAASAGMKALARMHVLRDGDEKTLEWIRTNPLPAEYNRALLAGALTVIARQNPELAVRWIDIAKQDGVDTRTFLPRIARSWGLKKPLEAIEFMHARPMDDQGEKVRAMDDIGTRWASGNPTQMREWLSSKKGESWTDPLRSTSIRSEVVNKYYRVDWNDLMDETSLITDPTRRNVLYAWILQRWRVADAEGAEAWLQRNPTAIPEDFVEKTRGIAPHLKKEILAAIEHAPVEREKVPQSPSDPSSSDAMQSP
jgi:hypothetical protein